MMQDTIIRKTLELISAANTLTLPVDTRRIAEHFRYEVRYYSRSAELLRSFDLTERAEQKDAVSAKRWDRYYIFISDDLDVERERWMIAHELGHITLGHLENTSFVEPNQGSDEPAELFALTLLASPPLLDRYDISCPDDIRRITGLSLNDSRKAYLVFHHYQLRQQDASIGYDIARRARVAARTRPLNRFFRRAY